MSASSDWDLGPPMSQPLVQPLQQSHYVCSPGFWVSSWQHSSWTCCCAQWQTAATQLAAAMQACGRQRRSPGVQGLGAVQGSSCRLYVCISVRPLSALSPARLLLCMAARRRVSGLFGFIKCIAERRWDGFLGWFDQEKLNSDNCCKRNITSNKSRSRTIHTKCKVG